MAIDMDPVPPAQPLPPPDQLPPDPLPVATVSIYRHGAKSPYRYFYDTQIPNSHKWSSGVLAWHAPAAGTPGTIPIYQHSAKTGPDRHFLDTQVPNDSGWTAGTLLCYAYSSQQPGTVPIYEHLATTPCYRYFYDDQAENHYQWTPGRIVFYAYPAQLDLLDRIVGVLGWDGGQAWQAHTYLLTEGNRFTLRDTPHVWGSPAPVQGPTPAGQALLADVQDIIANAVSELDLALLWEPSPGTTGMPDGLFRDAIVAGFRRLVASGHKPIVRIIVGTSTPAFSNRALTGWLTGVLPANLKSIGFPLGIAFTRRVATSWNHGKIVAADGSRALVGGHNMWTENYLRAAPVHDVSALVEGPAAAASHGFCSALWRTPNFPAVLSGGRFVSGIPPVRGVMPGGPPPAQPGRSRVLSIGRLGGCVADKLTPATNASETARVLAICCAETSVEVSQQALDFATGYDYATIWALVRALRAGVSVRIVVSNTGCRTGYGGDAKLALLLLHRMYVGDRLGLLPPAPSVPSRRDDLQGWADLALQSNWLTSAPLWTHTPGAADVAAAQAELSQRLSIAPLYFAKNVNYWSGFTASQKYAANHAKVYIIDSRYLYVGSDNWYAGLTMGGLAEYGHIVARTDDPDDDAAAAIRAYWDPLWEASAPHRLPAPRL